jgi:protein-S-isoprenylcysteine O-methyltransferase Ste14
MMLVVIQNSYAAATVRVEAGQKLISTGLYGLVRHPMYTGNAIMMAADAQGEHDQASAAQPGAAGLRQGTLAMSYSSRASMALLASCACATCCAV